MPVFVQASLVVFVMACVTMGNQFPLRVYRATQHTAWECRQLRQDHPQIMLMLTVMTLTVKTTRTRGITDCAASVMVVINLTVDVCFTRRSISFCCSVCVVALTCINDFLDNINRETFERG